MTDPDVVARALSRLAVGAPRTPERRSDRERVATDPVTNDPERVVCDAEAAMERVDRAAAFLDADGETRLRRAVQTAEARGESSLVSRGRAVLTRLEAFRTAANDDSRGRDTSERQTTSTPLAQRSSRGES